MCKAYGTNRPVTNLFNYKSKQVHNERTEAYLFLIKNLLITWKSRGKFGPTLLNQSSTKQLDTSTKQYNLSNWNATTKQPRAWIKKNKPQVRMILRARKILWAHLKRKKRNGMVMFLSMNMIKNLHFNLWNCMRSTANDHQSDKRNFGVVKLWEKGITYSEPRLANLYW